MPTATGPQALPTVETLAGSCGLDNEMVAFLQDKGVLTSGVMYHLFADRAKIETFFAPLQAGVTLAGTTVRRTAEELMVIGAVVRAMLDEVDRLRAVHLPPHTTPAAPTTSSTADASDLKVPKVLPKGYWNTLVQEYEAVTIQGKNRVFPGHLLLGAEEILSRMVHEHQTSKLYTPLKLGEIISIRHFTPTKAINTFAQKEDKVSKLLLDDQGTWVKQPRWIPEPQKLTTLLDALDSVKWAMIFARWGEESDICEWVEHWSFMCRDYHTKFPQIRAFYLRASWQLAMDLRSGKSFKESTLEIRQWPKHDDLNRWMPSDSPNHPFKGKDPKGKGKGKEGKDGKTRPGRTWTPSGSGSPTPHSNGPYQRPACRLWAAGSACKFSHGQSGAQHPFPPPAPPGLPSART